MEGVYRGSLETKQAGVLHAGFTKYIAFLGRLTIGVGCGAVPTPNHRYHDPTLQLHGLPCSIFQGERRGECGTHTNKHGAKLDDHRGETSQEYEPLQKT